MKSYYVLIAALLMSSHALASQTCTLNETIEHVGVGCTVVANCEGTEGQKRELGQTFSDFDGTGYGYFGNACMQSGAQLINRLQAQGFRFSTGSSTILVN